MGKNSYIKTHPLQAKHAKALGMGYKTFIHAEINAISRLSYLDLEKAHKIVVTRFGKSGDPLLSKPCPICQRAISFTNIKIINHT